ncbi:MAG: transglycosylase SLT domain-containing protein, partial [Proteobacteria bacterium]|nr:transglycosylase SLT domain-containing protein [Pseudomonadota bacterium]
MTAQTFKIINKYQGVASRQVIHAVETAAARTGADFSFLMEKASTESGFNSAAKAKSSTATGLFQFIDSTWLHMVKEFGPKYGLGKFADQIQDRDGKLCVDDCQTKSAILDLRKNPEIAALMAGEFSTGNKQYLTEHTNAPVGRTELYLAHFLGAHGAADFLNNRENNGLTV